ncbi:MAG: thioredoxin-disulfide reductase [Anaerolineaceae bacterium]
MDFNLTNLRSDSDDLSGEILDVIIIGAGPAGMSAALYAARAELKPFVLTGMELGGQASLTDIIENYPGFPDGVGGNEISELFQKHAERFGAKFDFDSVMSVDFSKKPYRVTTYSREYLAKAVIISTGASPNLLNVPGEKELTGRGVSYCATCDGWFFKDKKVVVVGGGDSALEEGLFLTRYAASVTIVHRRDSLRASAILQKRAADNPKINFIWNSVITSIEGDNKVEKVLLKNVESAEKSELLVDGVFIFIGHTPNSQLFINQLDLDERGNIKTDSLMRTNLPGIFAAGEVMDSHFRQVVTSAGMGAAAAIEATRYLESEE